MADLDANRLACINDINARRPRRYKEVDFAGIVDALIAWSKAQPKLFPREAKDQNTVSFSVGAVGPVLWSVYPRREDGAKVSVLTHWFRKLPPDHKSDVLGQLARLSPSIQIHPSAELDVPLHLLATERALAVFRELLTAAISTVERNTGLRSN